MLSEKHGNIFSNEPFICLLICKKFLEVSALLFKSLLALSLPNSCADADAEEIFETCLVQFSGADYYQFLLAVCHPYDL